MTPLAPYRSPDAREEAVDALSDALNAEVHTLGVSVEGRAIRAVRVPGGDDGAVLVCADRTTPPTRSTAASGR